MRLAVRHLTRYRFAHPMRGVVQSHRLTPVNSGSQQVLSWQVSCDGAIFSTPFTDGAGDIVQTMTLLGPVEELKVEVEGEVETADTAGVLRGRREATPPMAYLRSTRATRSDIALTELAASVEGEMAPLERAHALSAAVSGAIRFEPGRTGEATTAAEALSAGVGVCQDHAHALIATAIIAGLPARYVTGYLLTGGGLRPMSQEQDANGQSQSMGEAPHPHGPVDPAAYPGGEASHAWAELWVEGLGWVGFDAANECCPDERYIRLGSGFDAADAAPIRGVAHGVGEESLHVDVGVQQLQQ